MSNHDEHPLDYLPELALNVLGEAEAIPLRLHLADCDLCRGEFDEMSRVTRFLPLAAEDMEPASTLKDGVFERISAEKRVLPFRPAGNMIRPRLWQWRGAIAASVAALLLAGGAAGFALRGGGDTLSTRDSARQAQALESAARGDLRVMRIQQGSERVALLHSPGSKDAFVLVEGLRPLPEGKAYQAWFTHDGKTFEPSAVFKDGTGAMWLPAADAIDGYAAMGFTIEDADGGAGTPSSAPFIVLDLAKSVRAR